MEDSQEQWGSKLGFVLAAMGSAVGLGNIWKFPYYTGQHGGGAFVLTYLLAVAIVAFPVMAAEMALGRRSGENCIGAFSALRGKKWTWLGYVCGLCPLMIMGYYIIIGGWTIKYFFSAFTGLMSVVAGGGSADFYTSFVASPTQLLIYTLLFAAITAFVVYKGIGGGIEKACKVMMPALFIMLIVLVVRAVTLPGGSKGLLFYLQPHFEDLSRETILSALGQAFFTMSLGMGVMITYGAYIPKSVNISKSAMQVCFSSAFVALMAGLIVFPATSAFGVAVNSGPQLTFVTLPNVFSKMVGGTVWAALFFLLMFFAALTSSISLFEVTVSWFVERRVNRLLASLITFVICMALAYPNILSLMGGCRIGAKTWMDWVMFVTDNLWIPINALFVCIFAGWLNKHSFEMALTNDGTLQLSTMGLMHLSLRVIAPIAIFVIMLAGLI